MSRGPYDDPRDEVPYDPGRRYYGIESLPEQHAGQLYDGDTVHVPGYPDYRDYLDKDATPRPTPRSHWRWLAPVIVIGLVLWTLALCYPMR